MVVGLPRLLSGAEGQAATDARAFVDRLTRLRPNVRIELGDERLTTRQAERAMIEADARRAVRKAKIDAVAAALILQGWLDARAATPG